MMRAVNLYKRLSHSLNVPYTHAPVTDFVGGIPTRQVRDLQVSETNWNFWTSSQAFYEEKPRPWFVAAVPADETWIVERFGKYSKSMGPGFHLFLPMFDKVKTVKSNDPISIGVMTRSVGANSNFDLYTIAHLKITDLVTSAYFKNDSAKIGDSEAAVALLIQKNIKEFVKDKTEFTSLDLTKFSEKIKGAIDGAKEELGVECIDLEFSKDSSLAKRETKIVFETGVADKLRALDAPFKDPSVPGHGLANDYWANELTPPFFEKKKYGSAYEPVTPAAVSLEWCVPSPPDYHHFNMIPKMVAPLPTEDGKVSKSGH